ncbi:MAG: hypothetical protein JNL58_04035 [Planctomyces sp.]|nr:hypothetical protein [Planctomyces sp.]
MKRQFGCLIAAAAVFSSTGASAADQYGLERGTADVKSATTLAFGPEDILFIGDSKSAAVFAVATGDTEGDAASAKINVADIGTSLASLLEAKKVTVNDLAVNPGTGSAFLAVTADDKAAIVKVDGGGKMTPLSLDEVRFAKVSLKDAPEDKVVTTGRRSRNNRDDAITDIAYFEGKILVSGLSSSAAPSALRELSFPFATADSGVSVEIYHAAHGKSEDYAAMRTFVPIMIDGEPNVVGAYVCTPLVRVPVKELEGAAEKVRGTTVAELGNRNRPLDLISYSKEGSQFLLLSNSDRGVMKISTDGIKENKGLTEPVSGGGTAGQKFESIAVFEGVVQMDKLNDTTALILTQSDTDVLNLKTVELP